MPRRNWRAHVGRRREGGGLEFGVEITEEVPQKVPGKFVGRKPESIFKNVRNLPRDMYPYGISLARVTLSGLEMFLSPGQTNIDDGLEMQLQGPHIVDAVDRLKESGVTSKQAAKFVFNQLRNAGVVAEEDAVFRQVQIEYGEIKREEQSRKITRATTFQTKSHKPIQGDNDSGDGVEF